MTEYRLTIPDVRCLVCRKMGSGAVRGVYRTHDGQLRADIECPNGWIQLVAHYAPDGLMTKTFGICRPCYDAHPHLNGALLVTEVERQPPKEE